MSAEEINTVPVNPPTESSTAPASTEHVGFAHKIKDVITGEHHHGHDHRHHPEPDKPDKPSTVENAGSLGQKQELGGTDPPAQVGYGTAVGLSAVQGIPVAGSLPRTM